MGRAAAPCRSRFPGSKRLLSTRFTLAEAERLLPQVERLLREAVAQKSEYAATGKAVDAMRHRVTMLGGVVPNRERFADLGRRREASEQRLRRALDQFEELGCVVKDLDIGLVDFPTLFRGAEVYLCWKLGEPHIEFWHNVEEGFGGRKPIDQDFLDHHGAGA